MEKLKKTGLIVLAVIVIILAIIGGVFLMRSSTQRAIKDLQSEYTGGLNRTVNVYSYNGEKLATYNGKIDLAEHSDGTVKFDLNGKRYMYYNAVVEVIEN